MRPLPTDLQILNAIYERYYDAFCALDATGSARTAKALVPIDCKVIGEDLDVDAEIVFSRLYYHLDRKYSYMTDDDVHVSLFMLQIGADRHLVHFPLLSSVLAQMREERRRYALSSAVAVISAIVAVVGAIVSLLARR